MSNERTVTPQMHQGRNSSTGTITIYLVRHGQTELNASGLLRGRLDPQLDAKGTEQAKALGRYFADMDIDAIVSSPLRRARATAEEIALDKSVPVTSDWNFIDRDYATFAGKPKQAVIEAWGSLDNAPGVEPAEIVLQRAWVGLEHLSKSPNNHIVIVVSHDAILSLLLSSIDPKRWPRYDSVVQETAHFHKITLENGKWNVEGVNRSPDKM